MNKKKGGDDVEFINAPADILDDSNHDNDAVATEEEER